MISKTNFEQDINTPLQEQKIGQYLIEDFPEELTLEIFSFLGLLDICSVSITCKTWKQLEETKKLKHKFVYEHIAFGKDKWVKYFHKDIFLNENMKEDFDALPKDIVHTLMKELSKDKKRLMDEIMLVWIPQKICGNDLNFRSFKDLVKSILPAKKSGYYHIDQKFEKLNKEYTIKKSFWVMMTKNILNGTLKKTYEQQKFHIDLFSTKMQIDFEVPTVLETTVCMLTEYIRTKKKVCLFPDRIFTRCQEVDNEGVQAGIGNYKDKGFYFSYFPINDMMGMAAIKKYK